MLTLDGFLEILDKKAPLKYSKAFIARGDHDNSGIIVRATDRVNKVLFSLDLSVAAVTKAIRLGCDTIVTHHPAIYMPISKLSANGDTRALLAAAARKINVISMHLNLDAAQGGIDESLCLGFGTKDFSVIDKLDESVGYGKEFYTESITFAKIKAQAKKVFGARRIITYGNAKKEIKKIASFCGGGASNALKYIENGGDAELIVTSDMPHHVIKEMIESNVCVMLLTHYAAENYGFKRYYERITDDVNENAECFFFTDERFM